MNRALGLAALVVLVGLAGSTRPVEAAKVKTWHQPRPAQPEKAELKKAVSSSLGAVRLSRQLKPLASLDATHVWAVAEDRAGNLYVGTGEEGRLYKIAPDGKTTLLYSSENSQILSLAVAPDGSVYAGTGPTAQVVKIDPAGQARVLCELAQANYVWALALEPKDSTLLAATGAKGKIYRISADGKPAILHDTHQDHVLCLAVADDGTIYAGTDKTGRVIRIDARGKGFVLHQAPQSEVRVMQWTQQGLYFGTASTGRRGSSGTAGRGSEERALTALTSAGGGERVAVRLADKESTKSEKSSKEKETKGVSAEAPSTPASGENSVYRLGSDGAVREVFRAKVLVLSLLKHGKELFVGTGIEGQLFEVNEAAREQSEIARLDHGQILGLCRRRDGSIVVATGDPGKLYTLKDSYVKEGTLTSEILDAKLVSKWGALTWRADTPAKSAVSVSVRSGNVSEPDETWSDWSAEAVNAEDATVAAPPARFLQYRVTLSTDDPAVTPVLRSLTIRYATTNQAPEVSKIEVPDLNAVNLDNPRKLKIKWSAVDANEDELRYSVLARKDGWSSWVLLEEDLEKSEFEWDTTSMPTGTYRVKVVASDRLDNPEKEALTGERISDPVVVCHTAPTVKVKLSAQEGDRAVIEATASSPLVRLASGSFAVNGRKWTNVFPDDGLYDGKSKAFRFRTDALKPGTYVLVLKVQDAAGNTGSADVMFTVPAGK
jgi:outer membrane protein assembly factor BamB